MSAKETSATSSEHPFHSYAGTAQETFKEIVGWQIKTGQSFFDQGLRYAQTYADLLQTQLHEGTRISQELIKVSLSNAAELKKTFAVK